MAGYSGTPLPKKLGVKEGHRLALVSAPPGFEKTLGPVPAEVTKGLAKGAPFDVIVWFVKERGALEAGFEEAKAKLDPSGGLWVSWPKKASGVKTDITEDVVREIALDRGLVDNKVCAIDETWSGLRLCVRLKDRPKPSLPAAGSGGKRSRGARRKGS
ncbi:MAG: DUF3052 family protein [Planctomycetota bacterium]